MNIDTKSLLHRLSKYMLLSLAVILIIAYSAHLLGIKYFVLPAVNVGIPFLLQVIIAGSLFYINLIFCVGASLQIGILHSMKYSILYMPVWVIHLFIPISTLSNILFTMVYVIIFIIVLAVVKRIRPLKYVALRAILFLSTLWVYNLLSGIIKLRHNLFAEFNYPSAINGLFYQIDLIALCVLLYFMLGGVKNVLESCYAAHREIPDRNRDENSRARKELSDKAGLIKVATIAVIVSIQVIQLVIVLGVTLIGNVFFECIVILPVFWISRKILGRAWHSNNVFVCTAISTIVFYLASRGTIPLSISMMSPIITGVLLSVCFYMVAIHFDKLAYRKFNLLTCDAETLLKRCQDVGIAENELEFCKDVFVRKLSIKEAADKYHLEYQSVKNKKLRLSKRLKSEK